MDRRTLVRNAFSIIALSLAMAAGSGQSSAQNRPIRFWNLTKNTISEFYLAPTGTSKWGPNLCKNDKDGRVDFDERLPLRDVSPGNYDARFTDTTGRTCTVRNIKIDSGAIISIAEKDLTSCEPR
jgi:hypothetical protein